MFDMDQILGQVGCYHDSGERGSVTLSEVITKIQQQ
jgi:hypothetical protein